MRKMNNISFIYIAVIGLIFSTNSNADDIRVILRTIDGAPVSHARLLVRKLGDPNWEPIPTRSIRGEEGIRNAVLANCTDPTIYYRAEDPWGLFVRPLDDRVCSSVLDFSDFQPVGFASMGILADEKFWVKSLQNASESGYIASTYAAKFQGALDTGQFGTIAIAGSEMAAQMRAAGKLHEARLFDGVAIDATVRGIALAGSDDAEFSKNIETLLSQGIMIGSIDTGYFMTDAAQKILFHYQGEFDLTPNGLIDWRTMRSLPGGANVNISELKISEDFLSQFAIDSYAEANPELRENTVTSARGILGNKIPNSP